MLEFELHTARMGGWGSRLIPAVSREVKITDGEGMLNPRLARDGSQRRAPRTSRVSAILCSKTIGPA